MSENRATPAMWDPVDPVKLQSRRGRFTPGPAPQRRAKLEVEPGPPPQKRPPSWTPAQPTRTVKPRSLNLENYGAPMPGLDFAPASELPTRIQGEDLPEDTLLSAASSSVDFRDTEHDWFESEAEHSDAHDGDFTLEPAPTRTGVVAQPDIMLAAAIAGGVLFVSSLVAAGAIAAAVMN